MFIKNLLNTPAISVLFLATALLGCRNMAGRTAMAQPAASMVAPHPPAPVVLRMPDDPSNIAYHGLTVDPIRKFYAGRQDRLFWTAGNRSTPQADSLIHFIRNVRYFGLLPGTYNAAEIEALSRELASRKNIFRFEACLTGAYISMVQHIWLGRTAPVTKQADSIAVSLLEAASSNGGLVQNITLNESSHQGYRVLKAGLRSLIDTLSADQRDEVLLNGSATPGEIDATIRKIEVNMERWRLEKKSFGDRYILINIPEFRLSLVENDSVILDSRVIVGTFENQTPELSSTIECFVTYPYWHVPRKIAVEEYLPFIQTDTSFLSRNNFDVLDRKGNVLSSDSIEWSRFNENYFPVILRQRQGSDNSLGVIKFIFDNPYSVFLHDTNAKKLFNSKSRAFSHGCIRLEKAVELAHLLVTGAPGRESKYITRFLKEKTQHWIDLKNPIPIHIRYYTCAFKDDTFVTYKDVYAKDKFLYTVLYPDTSRQDL